MDGPTIIADAFVITCDPRDYGGRMSILVRAGQIADLSLEARVLRDLHPDAAVVDARQMLVIPGFVNAHFHPGSLLFRDLTSQLTFPAWKEDPRFMERTSRIASPAFHEDLLVVLALAAVRHLRSGVTTVSQVIPPVDARQLMPIQEAVLSNGVRTVTVLVTWDQIAEVHHGTARAQQISISLGNVEDFTVYSFDNLTRAARELGVPLFADLGEVKEEVETVRRYFKKGLLSLLRDFKALDPSLHCVHVNHGGSEDVRLAAEHGVTITLSPRSAAAKRSGYPLLRHLGDQPVQLCLGTDWGDTDMLREMTFMNDLPLLFAGMPMFTPLELLRMATINGAKALGLSGETGSIERGKQADLVAFGLKPADLQHLGDVPAAPELASVLLMNLTRSDIVRVMAQGTTVYQNGSCTLLDEAAIVSGFRRIYASMAGLLVDPSPAGRARIIPFVSPPAPRTTEFEGFEEGFAKTRESARPSAPGPAAPGVQPGQSDQAGQEGAPPVPDQIAPFRHEARRPELSKNVRRVFGDDDDPAPQHK